MNRLLCAPGQRYRQQGFHDWRIRPTHAGEYERIPRYIARVRRIDGNAARQRWRLLVYVSSNQAMEALGLWDLVRDA